VIHLLGTENRCDSHDQTDRGRQQHGTADPIEHGHAASLFPADHLEEMKMPAR
jgi:hypothetical protein